MKTMTCSQLGGACEMEFHAETFDEIAQLSKKHGTEMAEKGDKAHLELMGGMKELMSDNQAMEGWVNKKRNEFNTLPEDD